MPTLDDTLDTQLGRPPRHERKRKISDLHQVGEVPPEKTATGQRTTAAEGGPRFVEVDIDERRPCSTEDCDGEVVFKFAGPMQSAFRAMLDRQLAGEVPVYCSRCEDDHDRQDDRLMAEARRRTLPRKWRETTWDDLEVDDGNREAIEAAREWGAAKRRRGLLLWGEVGRGKTAIAATAARERMAYQAVRWLSVADLLMDLRMPFDSPEYARAQRLLDSAKARAGLVLDDLDKTKPTEHALQPLYVAINGWVEADLPLIVTMNRDLDTLCDDFGDRFGEPIASRLAEHCDVFEVSGRDRRVEP